MSKIKLGKYIEQTDRRNSDLRVRKLLGISIDKIFIESHANIVGVDFSNYKIVKKGEFAYGPVTSRNGDKISIARLNNYDNCIISSSYITFKASKDNELNPEYLMLIFKNPKFDRYARYNSWGSAREVFSWEDFCNIEIELPSLKEQQKIVDRYNTINNRIDILTKINNNLERLGQLLYKKWFIDFEFPNKEGKPYKSSGGKMIYNDELEKEIPEGWVVKKIVDVCNIKTGKEDVNFCSENGKIPFFSCSKKINYCDFPAYNCEAVLVGGNGEFDVKYYKGEFNAYQRTYILTLKDEFKEISLIYFICLNNINYWKNNSNGSVINYIKIENIRDIIFPFNKKIDVKIFDKILEQYFNNFKEINILLKLRDKLLSNL